jgi:D-beta-D-heptose 7-phosphate kinase / D-beta-D-heptose 1-phosphate adenosyltransferase
MTDLAALLDEAGRPRLLVVGDLILDRYSWGDAERISPEAPVPVLHADLHEVRPGGAASVAALLRALDADVSLAGVRGADAEGRLLSRVLAEAGVEATAALVDTGRPTTIKERFMGRAGSRHAQQLLRVDRESREPLQAATAARLTALIAEQITDVQAVLVSDYGKGVCTPGLLAALRAITARQGVPLLIDPARQASCQRYHGADLLKPNRAQAELATGRKILSPDDGLAAGQALCRQLSLGAALVTLDRDGLVLTDADGPGEWFPTQARAVYDITGAGDMVLAMLGLCRAAGLPLEAAVRLANAAAGLEVERQGVAPVSRAEVRAVLAGRMPACSKIVTEAELTPLGEECRLAGRSVVFTNGCFDLLHVGHISYLQEAAQLGDVLVVGVNSDRSVRELKGAGRPIVPQDDRAALLAALSCVDHVVVFDNATPVGLLWQLRPDVLVKGGTYAVEDVVGREVVEGYGGRVCVTGQVADRSTSQLLAQVRGG